MAGAGIDVFVYEPPYTDHILFTDQNIICSPHSAAQIREALKIWLNIMTKYALRLCEVKKCFNVVNPDVHNHPLRMKNKEAD
ncbi:MAG: hypothetical protein AB7E42_10725 [Anaerotignaceae bacterium]